MSETVTECAECHLTSVLESQFRVGFTRAGKRARLCPVCWRRDQASNARIRAYWMLGVGVVGVILPESPLRWFMMGVTSGYILAQLLTPLHEAAHALAAYALGFHLNQFKIGWWSEPVVWLRWGRCTIELCSLVEGGMVLATTGHMHWFRLRQILITAAGPAFHLVLVIAAVAIRYRAPLGSWTEWGATIVFLTNGFELVHNLYPRTVASPDGPVRNDGMLILYWCFAKPEERRQQRMAYLYRESLYLLQTGRYDDAMHLAKAGRAEFPDDLSMESLEAFCWSGLGHRDEARARYQAMRQHADLQPESDAAILSFLVYLNLMDDDPKLLHEALEHSARAYSMLPWDPMIKGPRGAALVASGQVDAGLDLLQQAFHQCFEPESRAFHAAFIAWGKHQQGDAAETRRYLTMATRLEPRAASIRRVEAALTDSESLAAPPAGPR